MSSKFVGTLLVAIGFFIADASLSAAEPASTVITVGEMCGGCVKKISARLSELSNVADVKCDPVKKTVTVTPKPVGISARVLWEAMDEIGKSPKLLVDAIGTYTTKPQN
ncbi:MAG: cation transporter [Planctomycetales bacterium]|nr:cation transporter [Planctomycetales bacterium]